MFDGPEYDPSSDFKRLSKQHLRIKHLMSDGRWRTLTEIAEKTGDPAASISAQMRHLRKPRFGSYIVERRPRNNRIDGLFEYRVLLRPKEEEVVSDEFGMSVDDFHCEPKQTVLPKRWKSEELPVTSGYTPALPRANLILVREHLQNAMRAGLNSEALRCVVQAIKEIER